MSTRKTASKTLKTASKRASRGPATGKQLEALQAHAFPPGISGNPGGRPSKRIVSDMIIEEISKVIKDQKGKDVHVLRGLVQQLILKASKGDVNAFREMADRAEGKVLQGVELTTPPDRPLQFEMMTPEEKDNKLAELLARQIGAKDGKRKR